MQKLPRIMNLQGKAKFPLRFLQRLLRTFSVDG